MSEFCPVHNKWFEKYCYGCGDGYIIPASAIFIIMLLVGFNIGVKAESDQCFTDYNALAREFNTLNSNLILNNPLLNKS